MWLAFFASFAVKMPMWPVHTWLPDAHVQAPTAGSVVLAAILLKMGGYGFLRFSVPMFPVASELMANFVFTLSVIAIIYTSLVAMVQEDMKKLIAYSSVAHMGFVTMGIFALNRQGIDGAIFQMISHGFVSGALFLVVGVLYDRMHTREIAAYGGLAVRMPVFALVFMLFTLANVGLPGTSGFVGEFLTLAGAFQVSTWVAFFATSGVILSACYALWLYRRVVFGDLIKESLKTIQDMGRREKLIFAPLVVAMIVARGLSGADPRHHRPVGGGADRPYPGGAGGFRPDARRELKGPAMLAENLNVILPEAVLAVFAMAMLLWGAYAGREVGRHVLWASCIVLALVGLWVGFQPAGTRSAFDGSFVNDGFARFAKVMILFGAAAALALSKEYLEKAGLMKFEYPVLILLSAVGMMTMVSAQDLLVLYMGLELQSLALYVVAAFRRDSLRSTEAGLKYFVLGALSSGLLLYGASLHLRLFRHHRIRRDHRGDRAGAAAAGADLRAGVSRRRASPSRCRRCRSTCGRPTSTRARRRR